MGDQIGSADFRGSSRPSDRGEPVRRSYSEPHGKHRCVDCGAVTHTLRGLSIHRGKMHPDEKKS